MKKCITIHLPELDTVRCRFFGASRGRAPWTSTRTLPWNCWGLVAPASTQMYCVMTDGHCMLCLQHDTRPRPKGKINMNGGGGGINRAASPAASLPPRHCVPSYLIKEFALKAKCQGLAWIVTAHQLSPACSLQ